MPQSMSLRHLRETGFRAWSIAPCLLLNPVSATLSRTQNSPTISFRDFGGSSSSTKPVSQFFFCRRNRHRFAVPPPLQFLLADSRVFALAGVDKLLSSGKAGKGKARGLA